LLWTIPGRSSTFESRCLLPWRALTQGERIVVSPLITAVTDKVHLVQGRAVNWLIVADDAGVMLIDAGYPGDRGHVMASLAALGHRPDELRAVLLTHAHVDHLGSAIWLAKTHGTQVYCHADEVGHARREYEHHASARDVAANLWRPSVAIWSARMVRLGGLSREGIPTARPLTAEITARLPGRPQVIPTPGHTMGHCSYLVDGVLASGDALVTGHAVLPEKGPQLLPELASHNQEGCLRSLAMLASLDTEALAPGHGDLWRGPIRDAAEAAAARVRRAPRRGRRLGYRRVDHAVKVNGQTRMH
jgi:glyoxylase-like metal-dependent hydrolase (beta-lactamase superfamily II)